MLLKLSWFLLIFGYNQVLAGKRQEQVIQTLQKNAQSEHFEAAGKHSIVEMLNSLIEVGIDNQDDRVNIKSLYNKIDQDKRDQIKALFSGRSGNSKSKKKCKPGENCTNLFNLEALWSYGCFCNFGPNWHQSHGQPVNEIDSACRRLYQCYKCATIDGNLEGNICDPANEKYKVPVIRNVHNNGSYVACNQINRNPNISPSDPEYNAVNCKIRTCCCDLNFAKELLEYFFSGMIIDSSKKHANGFDFNQECPSPCADGSCKSGEKRCCGEYPLRFPYNTRDGERDCCWKKTYNTNRLQCCENTFIRKITQDCDG